MKEEKKKEMISYPTIRLHLTFDQQQSHNHRIRYLKVDYFVNFGILPKDDGKECG